MTSELVVDVQPKEVSIALLEDKSLVELQSEGRNISFSVGNMYLGRIKKLMPGLNACFVDVGYEKDAFLHYLDLGPQFNSLEKFIKQTLSDKKKLTSISKATLLPDLDKDGTVSNTLKVGQEVVVQIVKEPISTKGPRLTSEISFAGRYLVLIPFNDKVSVSQKIKSSEERARLKQLLMSIKPKNFGVIVRTVAEGKRVAELDGELRVLVKHWEDAMAKVQKATKYPTLIYEETSRAVGLLRDLFNPSFENIHVNDEAVYNEIKDYVSLIAPDRANIVKQIGAMAAALSGSVQAIVLTGGIAYNEPVVEYIRERCSFIAPIAVYPGENELEALVTNALVVLRGVITPKVYK